MVAAKIDGQAVHLLLDSCAAISGTILVNEPYHAALRKLAGNPQAKEYVAKEVSVDGTHLLANQRCLLRPFARTVIGSWFFDRYVITVDTDNGKVWLDRNE